jgi:hypothetical protein
MAIRRLTVIQEPTGEDAEAASRPAWQWVLIGSGLLVTIWTPAVVGALAIARKIAALRAQAEHGAAAGPAVAALLVAATFALSALAAGHLVTRFGQRTRLRHAVFAGLLAAGEIWLLALLGGAFGSALLGLSALLSLSALAAGFCALGSLSRRPRR